MGAEWILFDKVSLTEFDAKAAKAAVQAAPLRRVKLSASCSASGHPISPYIYGIVGDVTDLGATTRRWGGNPTTRYNWQAGDLTNVGKDWYFENTKTGSYVGFISASQSQHVTSALTVPMVGWVAKDTSSFDFRSLSTARSAGVIPTRAMPATAYEPMAAKFRRTRRPRPASKRRQNSSNAGSRTITKQDEKQQTRSIQQYILDNEPNLWSINHRGYPPKPADL